MKTAATFHLVRELEMPLMYVLGGFLVFREICKIEIGLISPIWLVYVSEESEEPRH